MESNDVQQLIGRRVRVGLGPEGAYVGELLELAGTPWCGRVRVTGVIVPARHYENGVVCRRGYRPGEFIDAGRGTVSSATEMGYSSYLDAVSARLNHHVGSHSGYPTSPYPWVPEAFGRALRAVMVAEEHRVRTGQWRLSPADGQCNKVVRPTSGR